MSKSVSPIEEAAFWYACLKAEDATEQDHRHWQQWLDASPCNQQAWARIQQIRSLFEKVPGKFASPVLAQKKTSRRAVLRSAVVAACAGLTGAETWRHLSSPELRADFRTGVGERQRQVLADGSLLYLNTRSAADVVFDHLERRVLLHAGEILIETRPDNMAGAARPFIVHTPHGRVRALGTRFVVRLHDGRSSVQVLQHAVDVRPALSMAPAVRLAEGQELSFDSHGTDMPRPHAAGAGAWRDGRLSVVDMRLHDFLAELARHRRGYMDCAPELAGLRVSGVFPLDDTDAALGMLADAFPLRVRYLTRYWATILPQQARSGASR
ncbi:FecR domain-containing protein [Thauera linaloolentis]|uniref:Fec operon regulator FecR n=1 Tax=Thauera linaloolentis (strain DSM 12138 / JCM 21573 / CCUG 41526 / CIP 105981 / IAM 15112 / NBRC 102519 / 47Lol) TaxID=1123367 RepID=N6Z479_THAL4|nr:FecR domain-containing protein [Thauera linaloolentis]ENO86904.1 fec operon regulator FecR [Thauera linaloolentis 47Lol = DSM 12138]MCM8566647.1 FecR domain-containing protein [Thauera linaloolentis]